MSLAVAVNGTKLIVRAPYHPQFAHDAKLKGGKWNSENRVWEFDARDEAIVRKLLIAVYGEDGSDGTARVTVRVTCPSDVETTCGGIYLMGRSLAAATGRDSGARLGDGVILIKGQSPRSGGSVANWKTIIRAGTVLQIRDVPKAAVERFEDNEFELEIVDETPPDVHAELVAEKGKLLARITEIDALLEAQS